MYLKEIRIITRKWIDKAHDRDYCRALVNEACKLHAQAMKLVKIRVYDCLNAV